MFLNLLAVWIAFTFSSRWINVNSGPSEFVFYRKLYSRAWSTNSDFLLCVLTVKVKMPCC